jgi:hypothetical protein
MAQNTTITVPANTWTLLTTNDVSALTFQNQSYYLLQAKGTVGAVAPSDFLGAIEYAAGQGEVNSSLSDLWPGISATRVYVFCTNICKVQVSHT